MCWELLDRKNVKDFDGFWTSYSLYTNGKQYVCVFGDPDIYTPDDENWDAEFDIEEEAFEWFDNYDTEENCEEYDFWKEKYIEWEIQDRLEEYL